MKKNFLSHQRNKSRKEGLIWMEGKMKRIPVVVFDF